MDVTDLVPLHLAPCCLQSIEPFCKTARGLQSCTIVYPMES